MTEGLEYSIIQTTCGAFLELDKNSLCVNVRKKYLRFGLREIQYLGELFI